MKLHPDKPSAPWIAPLAVLSGLMIVSTLIFWVSDLDLRCAAIFYAPPPAPEAWPQELAPMWRLCYYGAPFLAIIIALVAMATLIAGRSIRPHWRLLATYVLLTLAIGPGLLVNLVFKDHWGRPRPRQVEVFGGTMSYLPPLALGISKEEKSFPAGHASIGFSLCTLWFWWRKRRPRRATLALWSSLGLGLLLGLGRMAAGAHFFSDVLWAGFISFYSALVLYYFILRIPQREAQLLASSTVDFNHNGLWKLIYSGIGLAVVGGGLLGFPVYKTISYTPSANLFPLPPRLRLELRYANLTIYIIKSTVPSLQIDGEIRGFGLPTYKIDNYSYVEHQNETLVYTIKQRGFFTELDTNIKLTVTANQLQQLSVRIQTGDIHLIADHTTILPQLDLKTSQGRVQLPVETK